MTRLIPGAAALLVSAGLFVTAGFVVAAVPTAPADLTMALPADPPCPRERLVIIDDQMLRGDV